MDQMEDWIEALLKLDSPEDALTEKQSKILRSAVDIFAEKGYAAASTNEIAQRAGVAEGTIFRHFKSKQDLLFTIIGPTMVKFIGPFAIKGFEKVLDSPYDSFELFLKSVLRNRLEFAKKNKRVLRILLQEIPFQHELREQFLTHVAKTIMDKLMQNLSYYQQKGEMIEVPTLSALRFIGSVLIGHVVTHLLFFENAEDEELQADRIVDYLLYGMSSVNRTNSEIKN